MALMPQGPDTHPNVERVQLALLQQASLAQRFARARSLTQTTLELAKRAIYRAHPDFDEHSLLLAFVAIHYGEPLAARLRIALASRHP